MDKEFKISHDKYSVKRGGKSYIYDIKCSTCQSLLFVYQKDGKGDLVRCYKDRILAVISLDNISNVKKPITMDDLETLKCVICKQIIGTSFIYKAESRPAFRMIRGKYSRSPHV